MTLDDRGRASPTPTVTLPIPHPHGTRTLGASGRRSTAARANTTAPAARAAATRRSRTGRSRDTYPLPPRYPNPRRQDARGRVALVGEHDLRARLACLGPHARDRRVLRRHRAHQKVEKVAQPGRADGQPGRRRGGRLGGTTRSLLLRRCTAILEAEFVFLYSNQRSRGRAFNCTRPCSAVFGCIQPCAVVFPVAAAVFPRCSDDVGVFSTCMASSLSLAHTAMACVAAPAFTPHGVNLGQS